MKNKEGAGRQIQSTHIPVLDGMRAIAMVLIVWFHFWQQSWLGGTLFGLRLDWIPQTAYVLVDFLIFLSGFCLFLPYAQNMVCGTPVAPWGQFFQKRAARILPSYLFCLLALTVCVNLPLQVYPSGEALWRDLATHVTFTHTFFTETYQGTHLNGVLWTVAIEVQFYLLFPLIAKWFCKKPLLVYGAMLGVSLGYTVFVSGNKETLPLGMLINQLPSFFGVYANGLLGALIYVRLKQRSKRKRLEPLVATSVALLCLVLYWGMMQALLGSEIGQLWQLQWRYPLSLLFLLFLVSAALAVRPFRFLLANRLMVFLSAISFNLYIWHQLIAVKLKEFRLPYWEGDLPPNQTGDTAWMWQYTLLCWTVSILVACIMTFLIEKPMAQWILKKQWGKKIPKNKKGLLHSEN